MNLWIFTEICCCYVFLLVSAMDGGSSGSTAVAGAGGDGGPGGNGGPGGGGDKKGFLNLI